MDRRNFILTGSALAVGTLPACGGSEPEINEPSADLALAQAEKTAALVAEDVFSNPANTSLGPNWTDLQTGVTPLVTRGVNQFSGQYSAVGDLIATAYWSGPYASALSNDHASEIRLLNPNQYSGGNARVGVVVRASGSGSTRTYYEAVIRADQVANPTTELNKWVNGNRTTLFKGAVAWGVNDRLQLSVFGATLSVEKNGVPLGGQWTRVDPSPIPTGKPGIAAANDLKGGDWKAFNLGVLGGVTLAFDPATPEQMSLRCPVTGVLPIGTAVLVEYRVSGSGGQWVLGTTLRRVQAADLPGGVIPLTLAGKVHNDAYLGWVVDLKPGTLYEVRLRISRSGESEQLVLGEYSTRPLVSQLLPPITKTCNPSTFLGMLAGLVAGDHLRCLPSVTPYPGKWNPPNVGAANAPIYITASKLGDVNFKNLDQPPSFVPGQDPNRSFGVRMTSSHVVLENLIFEGPGIDTNTFSWSTFMTRDGGAFVPRNWTIRHCEVLGYDCGVKTWEPIENLTVHDCKFVGNNTWDKTYVVPLGDTEPRLTWNDSAFRAHGTGNVAFNCEFSGFGDLFTCGGPFHFNAANYMYRVLVLRTGDDCFEADQSSGNSCFYDCTVLNCGTAISADPTYGPVGFFRNTVINYSRGPLKLTSSSVHLAIEQNTFRGTFGAPAPRRSAYGVLIVYGDLQKYISIKNNIFACLNVEYALHCSAQTVADVWRTNAWVDGKFSNSGFSEWPNLAAAQHPITGYPARFGSDKVIPAQPFATAINPGATQAIEYTGQTDATLAIGSPARNVGTVIPGVNDGFSGAAPDIGAVVSGRAVPFVGVRGRLPVFEAGVWTPSRDANGAVVTSEFSRLPIGSTVTVGGSFNTLTSVREPTVYLNSNGVDSWGSYLRAWCGAAWNPLMQEIHIWGGGHGDVSAAFTGIYTLSARKMQFERTVGSRPPGEALKLSSATQETSPYGLPLIAGEPWYGGVNLPLSSGWPGTNHGYNGNVWIPPALAVAKGLQNTTRGWLYLHGNAKCLVNLDTGLPTKLHWRNHLKPGQFLDCSQAACLLDGDTIVSVRQAFAWDRWSLGASELTDWSTSGWDTTPTVPSFGKTLSSLSSNINFEHSNRAFCVMTERRECVSLAAVTVRVRLGAALDAGQTSSLPDAYQDQITFIGDGAADFVAVNFSASINMLYAAGVHYDHSEQCIWVLGNRQGDSLYKITGLNGNTWTVTRQAVTALTTCVNGTFGRMFVTNIGNAKVMVRVSDVSNPIEVTRLG